MWEDNNNVNKTNSLNSHTPENSHNIESASEPVYSFWAEQMALNISAETPSADPLSDIQNDNQEQELIQVPKDKSSRMRKFAGLLTGAVIFGIVAGASFLGFNRLYYHFNPEASPAASYVNGGDSNTGLNLERPAGDLTLSTTNVIDDIIKPETDVSDIVEQTMPATVAITSVFPVTSYFFGQPYTEENEGGGSGIIIGENSTEYLIATNNHVVDGASSVNVTFIDDTTYTAYTKGKDADADLAVIAIKKSDLSEDTKKAILIAKLGDSDDVKVGQMVIAIGNALGYGQSVTVGYVSAKDREITRSSTNTTLTVLQVDAAINPGNSGGALLNTKGEVIGINSAKLTGSKVEGIGYAIPITKALPIVSDLMTRETLSDEDKGYLGIYLDSMTDVTEEISYAYNWPVGVYIREMTEGSAAEKAGIQTGDIIIAVNDVDITTKDQLREKVTSYRHGTVVAIKIMRYQGTGFKELTIDVTLGTINK